MGRRKVDEDDDSRSGSGQSSSEEEESEEEIEVKGVSRASSSSGSSGRRRPGSSSPAKDEDATVVSSEQEGGQAMGKKKGMSKMKKEAMEYREKMAGRGVMYLSRVPPFMKPNKLRELLSPYGEITRLFLQEEDATVRKRRKAGGGNGSKQFTEGWIEYEDKKTAKSVARALNMNRIGTKKGDFYYDDLWNLKYLRGFKWEFLTEKFAYERRVREAKLRQKMAESRKVNAAFVEQVEKNKSRKFALERRRARGDEESSGGGGEDKLDGKAEGSRGLESKRRKFRQERVLASQHGEKSARIDERVLRDVFRVD